LALRQPTMTDQWVLATAKSAVASIERRAGLSGST